MNYQLIKDVIDLVKDFESENVNQSYSNNKEGFISWINDKNAQDDFLQNFNYEGFDKGRSLDSAISTHLVHLGRYAKLYSKAAIHNSEFATQDEFIFLITLKTFGNMPKMELIKRNIQDKPNGIQIINRLIKKGLINQTDNELDKRSKEISISEKGLVELENQMKFIRKATSIVSGTLSDKEKKHLIHLLNKLEEFHHPIYHKNIDSEELLEYANSLIDV